MKYFLAMILLTLTCMASDIKDKETNKFIFEAPKEDTNMSIGKKEQSFQDYLKELEKENQALEDDGFCPCNNY